MDSKVSLTPLRAQDLQNIQEPAAGFGGRQVLSLSGDKKLSEKEKLTTLAKEFESVFMGQMLKAMRSTVQKSGFIDGGRGEEVYSSLLDDELARNMAYSRTSGLSEALVQQLLSVSQGSNPAQETGAQNISRDGGKKPMDSNGGGVE
ncbi:MAG: rod-binding protein [Nitrospinae bacterium]|nr:rod-binding protein [Nitrospinota bacterium]